MIKIFVLRSHFGFENLASVASRNSDIVVSKEISTALAEKLEKSGLAFENQPCLLSENFGSPKDRKQSWCNVRRTSFGTECFLSENPNLWGRSKIHKSLDFWTSTRTKIRQKFG